MKNFHHRVNPVRWVALMGLASMAVSASAQIALTNPSYVGANNYVNDFNGGSTYSVKWNGRACTEALSEAEKAGTRERTEGNAGGVRVELRVRPG